MAWVRCVAFGRDDGYCWDGAFGPATFIFVFRASVFCVQDASETPFAVLVLSWGGGGPSGSRAFFDGGSLFGLPPIVLSVNLHWCAGVTG